MQTLKSFLVVCIIFVIGGCSDTFLRAMDEVNAGMGAQRNCTREAPYETDSYKGYSYKTGGLCNIWQGQISNYSKYTVRCENTLGGRRANIITAQPGQTTELRQIGHMNAGRLDYTCEYWARDPFVWKNYSDRSYQILLKMMSGKRYITVRNLSNYTKTCNIQDANKSLLVEERLSKGQTLRWIRPPSDSFFTRCSL